MVALVMGAIAAFLVRAVLINMAAGSERAGLTTTIVVAKKPIAFGAALTLDNLQEVPWKSADPLSGSFAKAGDLIKDGRRLALVSMQRDEPILEQRVTGPNQRATLSTQLDEGMRAVTVRVDEVRGVAGFILPGDRVDVITTRGAGGGQDAAAFADMLLQNVKVLAIDQLADERQDKPTVARAVTLELTVNQAQKVVLAEEIGRLSLVLRQPNTADENKTARVTVNDLGGDGQAARDKLAEMEKRLADIKAADDAARAQAERAAAQKMADMDARLRSLAAPQSSMGFGKPPTPPATKPGSSVVNVIRNGSKTESYTVSAER
ncbi:Flp pilus assembly protein CpaB [Lichenihabitans sp. Uapishka_5]|uniref:Flp pilus assembly protein CpaB n=1 Tax=Lichenihabitans sp. Uapishka_5 TaxID=3037302 RepID=UPI0029E7F24D|nr:Flp pilus assembly protein CpaB [Lichenihabitans sp. Uapishka_5]MDX7951728.1 Flp pilus assembly protein CpaB [Lichenihabitans sp. Uapishka_5]